MTFSDVQSGWLATDAGTVLATSDGGAGWTVVEKVNLDVKAIAATDYRTAWIVGNAAGAAGEPGVSAVLRTEDGGKTWTRTRVRRRSARRRRLLRPPAWRARRARQDLEHARRRRHLDVCASSSP